MRVRCVNGRNVTKFYFSCNTNQSGIREPVLSPYGVFHELVTKLLFEEALFPRLEWGAVNAQQLFSVSGHQTSKLANSGDF